MKWRDIRFHEFPETFSVPGHSVLLKKAEIDRLITSDAFLRWLVMMGQKV